MKNLLFLMSLVLSACANIICVSPYRAYRAYSSQDMEQARREYEQLLMEDPENPELNFDMGNVWYRMGEFEKSHNYFERIIQLSDVSDQLRLKALFNDGNSFVQRKAWDEAIAAYERALEIDADNEHVVHNLELAKKMREQQKQNNQNKDQQEKDSGNENQQKQQSNDSQSDKDQSQDNEQSAGDKPENESQGDRKPEEDLDRKKSEQEREKDGEKQQAGKQSEKLDRQPDDRSGKQSNADQDGQQSSQGQQHKQSPSDKQEKDSAGGQSKAGEEKDQEQSVYAQLLDALDKSDSRYNKMLIMRQLNKDADSQHGKKNW